MSKGDKQNQANKPNKERQDQVNTKNDLAGGKKTAFGRENEQNRSNKEDKGWQKR